MTSAIDYGSLLAGLGFFLLGMQQLEVSLKGMIGRPVKILIRRYTHSPLQGILVGAATTAILQSSSLVTLMLLAFVGAGILSLGNAIGIVLGANLGTTVTGWLVTAAGFKLNINGAALPIVGISALGALFFKEDSKPGALARFLLAIGFLLLGLGLMKEGVASLTAGIDIGALREFGPFIFAATGLALTGIIQSSSAAMLINLSALAAGLTTLPQSAAFTIGADIGTTFTVLAGSIKGKAASRQVALAHFFFNLCSATLAFTLLRPLLYLITAIIGIEDPLFALVAFHSLFNGIGILAFLPFIKRFAGLLERRFSTSEEGVARFICHVTPTVPDTALEALQLEVNHLFYRVLDFNRLALGIHGGWQPGLPYRPAATNRLFEHTRSGTESYEAIKELEGQVLNFGQALQEQALNTEEAAKLSRIQLAVRQAVQSAKSLKDVRHNLRDFAATVNDPLHARYKSMQQRMQDFYTRVEALWRLERSAALIAELASLAEQNASLHEAQSQDIYRHARRDRLDDIEVSTLLNVERELYSSNKALVSGLKDFLLAPQAAQEISELPGVP